MINLMSTDRSRDPCLVQEIKALITGERRVIVNVVSRTKKIL